MSRRIDQLVAEARRPRQAQLIDPLLARSLEEHGAIVPEPVRSNGEVYADDFWREKRRAARQWIWSLHFKDIP